MRNILLISVLLCFSLQITSCKTDVKKKQKTETKAKKTALFSLKDSKNNIDWVAYKTTMKIAVKGTFKKIIITNNGEGNSIKEAIDNAEFSIPVSSIFSSDTSRDFKLKKFFFGAMDNTKLLSGTLILENDSIGYASITMNSATKKLPFTYIISDRKFSLKAIMNIDNWNVKNAIDSLNIACNDLHKAEDGISKTWNEVLINITSEF